MKTVLEHLNSLPTDVKDMALENYRRHYKQLPVEPNSVWDALVLAFNWNISREGREFWETVYFKLKEDAARPKEIKKKPAPHKKAKKKLDLEIGKYKSVRKLNIKYSEYTSMDSALENVFQATTTRRIK